MSKTLVIILSETRASELTFENFKKNVIDELNADLCVCIGVKPDYDYENPFYKLAKYHFTYDEPDDFGVAFDEAFKILKPDLMYETLENVNTLYGKVKVPKTTTDDITYYGSIDNSADIDFGKDEEIVIHSTEFIDDLFKNEVYGNKISKNDTYFRQHGVTTLKKPIHWREFLKIKDQFFGGIKDPHNQHNGSAGILIFFRWFLLENLYKSDIINKYDRFIITRSDFIYQLPHPKVENMNPEHIWIPDAEHYGGLTDRHVVLSREHVKPYLNIFNNFVTRSNEYFMKMKEIYDSAHETLMERMHYLCNDLFRDSTEILSWDIEQTIRFKKYIQTEYFLKLKSDFSWNLEKLIKFHLEQNDVLKCVKEFPYVMYTVRNKDGLSRWANGDFDETLGYYIKYKSEYDKSTNYLKQFKESPFQNIQDFYRSIFIDIPR